MDRLRLALVFSVLYALMLACACSAVSRARAKQESFKWPATLSPVTLNK